MAPLGGSSVPCSERRSDRSANRAADWSQDFPGCLFARGGRLSQEDGKRLRRYWITACQDCSLKSQCTTGPEWRIPRWEHEHLLEAVQQRLDANPQAMRLRRETVEHPFGTMKARMGATHFLTKTIPKVAAEMALSVLAYNLKRVMNIVGTKPLIAAIAA